MATPEAAAILLGDLSPRELDVFKRLANGESLNTIAEELGIHPSTVSTYRARIAHKTGFDNDVDMAHFAIRHGIIPPRALGRKEPKR